MRLQHAGRILLGTEATRSVAAMNEITFIVEPCAETGGFVARWDAPNGGGIATQSDSFAELDAMIADAVGGYFESAEKPHRVRLHFTEDPVVALA